MAPFESIWPEQMHVPPTAVALAAKVLCGHPVLTSDIALASMFWRQGSGRHIETLDDLSDAAESFGLEPVITFTKKQDTQHD